MRRNGRIEFFTNVYFVRRARTIRRIERFKRTRYVPLQDGFSGQEKSRAGALGEVGERHIPGTVLTSVRELSSSDRHRPDREIRSRHLQTSRFRLKFRYRASRSGRRAARRNRRVDRCPWRQFGCVYRCALAIKPSSSAPMAKMKRKGSKVCESSAFGSGRSVFIIFTSRERRFWREPRFALEAAPRLA